MAERPAGGRRGWQERSAFVVWGRPDRGPRSAALARGLGIARVLYLHAPGRPGTLGTLVRYVRQAAMTLRRLQQSRSEVIFVQSPPSPAVWTVALYCCLTGATYVVDAHSAAFDVTYWLRPYWLQRLVARRAAVTLVTNEHWASVIRRWGGRCLVLPDVPTSFQTTGPYPVNARFPLAFVNTWAPDEPVAEVVAAARALPNVDIYITGRKAAATILLDETPSNVHFTDFLPDETYYALLSSVAAVMCLTTRDNTMQRGACEALWLGRPVITSDWPLLRSYFQGGAVHVDNTAEGIREGIERLIGSYDEYRTGVSELQRIRRADWKATKEILLQHVGAESVGSAR